MLKGAFFPRVGKFLGTVSLRLCGAQEEGRGTEKKRRCEKEVEREKEGGRRKETLGDREDKQRKDKTPSRACSEGNRAKAS